MFIHSSPAQKHTYGHKLASILTTTTPILPTHFILGMATRFTIDIIFTATATADTGTSRSPTLGG